MDIKVFVLPYFLNLDGIPSQQPRGGNATYLWHDPQGVWRLSKNDYGCAVQSSCGVLHRAFRNIIMQSVDYRSLLMLIPSYVSDAGRSSEAPISSSLFQKMLNADAAQPELNRFLYLYDCQRLVSSIQECQKEVTQIVGEFYFTLNTEPFFNVLAPEREDDLRWSTSPTTTKLTAYLNFIFIRLHSLMDYAVKVAAEAEQLRKDFIKYPKMSSQGVQFGDRKTLSINKQSGTLFENCEFIRSVETLRNHIIHDALLDEMPKAYERFENWVVVERFVLLPDMTNGRLDRYVNRNLFYGAEDKINLRLPDLLSEFGYRLKNTLDAVIDILTSRYLPPDSSTSLTPTTGTIP